MEKDLCDRLIMEALEDLVSQGLNHTSTLLYYIDRLYEGDHLTGEQWEEIERARAFVAQLTESDDEEEAE